MWFCGVAITVCAATFGVSKEIVCLSFYHLPERQNSKRQRLAYLRDFLKQFNPFIHRISHDLFYGRKNIIIKRLSFLNRKRIQCGLFKTIWWREFSSASYNYSILTKQLVTFHEFWIFDFQAFAFGEDWQDTKNILLLDLLLYPEQRHKISGTSLSRFWR